MPTVTIAIDFDDTITTGDAEFNGKKISYKGVRPRSWLTEQNIEKDIVCLEKIKDFMIWAFENDYEVAIATFSDKRMMKNEKLKQVDSDCLAGEELMKVYLQVILKDHPDLITKVVVKAFSPEEDERRDKNKHLEQLQNPVLLDDNVDNVQAAKKAGYKAALVNNKIVGKNLADRLDTIMSGQELNDGLETEVDMQVFTHGFQTGLNVGLIGTTTPPSSPEHSGALKCSDEWRKTSQENEEGSLTAIPMLTCSK